MSDGFHPSLHLHHPEIKPRSLGSVTEVPLGCKSLIIIRHVMKSASSKMTSSHVLSVMENHWIMVSDLFRSVESSQQPDSVCGTSLCPL